VRILNFSITTKVRKQNNWITLLGLSLFLFFLIAGCQKNDFPKWQSLGFEDKLAIRLLLNKPYLYVCADSDGLWRKDIESKASEWEYLGMSASSLGKPADRGVQDIVIDEENPSLLMVLYKSEQGNDHGIYRSLDAGQNWAPADSGLQYYVYGQRYFSRLHRFLQYSDKVLGAGHGIYITKNFGQHWERVDTDVGVEPVHSLIRHVTETNVIWLSGGSTFFQPILAFSADSGATWTPIGIQQLVPRVNIVNGIAFDPSDADVVYVGVGDTLIKTINSGESWIVPQMTTPQGASFGNILSNPANPDHFWATAGNSLIETWDAGTTWELIEGPIPEATYVINMIWDEKTKEMYIGTFNGVYRFKP
jgi:hypothetical protein